jgi:hypothetical protein
MMDCTFMEIIRFIFSSFWMWAGTLFLIAAFGTALGQTIAAVRGK